MSLTKENDNFVKVPKPLIWAVLVVMAVLMIYHFNFRLDLHREDINSNKNTIQKMLTTLTEVATSLKNHVANETLIAKKRNQEKVN